MSRKNGIDDLIKAQEGWIAELNDTLEKLKKYGKGTLPYNENQIDAVANAQAQLAKAVTNIAATIRDRLDKNQPRDQR